MPAMIMGILGVLFWLRSIILHACRSSFPDHQPHPFQIKVLLERATSRQHCRIGHWDPISTGLLDQIEQELEHKISIFELLWIIKAILKIKTGELGSYSMSIHPLSLRI